MKLTILISAILIISTSCGRINLLKYDRKRYYDESSVITSDTIFKLYQNICYNRPCVIDEEFCYYLTLKFIDTTAAKTKKKLDLQTDTMIVIAQYGIFSIWNWSDENNKISGQIEILKWNKDEVVLKENVQTIDFRRKETKKIIGTRKFNRKNSN